MQIRSKLTGIVFDAQLKTDVAQPPDHPLLECQANGRPVTLGWLEARAYELMAVTQEESTALLRAGYHLAHAEP